MENETKIVLVKTSNLYPHPDNPRKDIGDISEMVESVKKNGIMQNLTIMPLSCLDEEPEKQPEADNISLLSDFIVLIGHRRLSAAKEAHLEEVPCRIISKISKKEQVGIMLEENMQRNDLTIYEQAQGFQMMLDLGETAETIAEKTGFSTSTVYHRLNIAKLNQKELQKKVNDADFQLSLKDMYALEQIKDIKKRNKVLRDATSSSDLVWRANRAAKEERLEEAKKTVLKLLKAENITEAPKNVSYHSDGYERVKEIDLNKELPKEIKIRRKDPLCYVIGYERIYIMVKQKKEKKEKTAAELKRAQIDKNKKKIESMINDISKRRRDFVMEVITSEKSSVKDDEVVKDEIWNYMFKNNMFNWYKSTLDRYHTPKNDWECTAEEKEDRAKWINSLTTMQQYLVVLCMRLDNERSVANYDCEFLPEQAEVLRVGHKILERYGWYFTEEEQQLLDGTHELYEKAEEK